MATRRRVLNLYKRIMQASAKWTSKSDLAEEIATEKLYIKEEARKLFRLNKNIENVVEIETKIKEGEARLALGLHYKNPYPRPVYAPPGTMAGINKKTKEVYKDKLRQDGKPIYIDSIRDE